MQKTFAKKALITAVFIVLIAAVALFTYGCGNKSETPQVSESTSSSVSATPLGKGATKFTFTVTAPDGTESAFLISTDKTVVGEALQELNLIQGEEGPYGLYVKTVNGITVDYDSDGMYWAFYINGEMAPTGVDLAEIKPNESYAFKASK